MKTLLSIITLTSIILITLCYADDAVVKWKTNPADIIITTCGQVKTCVFEVRVENASHKTITPTSCGVNLFNKRFSYTSGTPDYGDGWAKKTYSVTCTDFSSFINSAQVIMWAQEGDDNKGYSPSAQYYEEYTY